MLLVQIKGDYSIKNECFLNSNILLESMTIKLKYVINIDIYIGEVSNLETLSFSISHRFKVIGN